MSARSRLIALGAVAVLIVGGAGIGVLYVVFYVWTLPGLEVGPIDVRVRGCDRVGPNGDDELCRMLICEKALLSNPAIGLRARIDMVSGSGGPGDHSVRDGYAYFGADQAPSSRRRVRCEMTGRSVDSAGFVAE